MIQFSRRYIFSLIVVAAILCLSLFPIPETELSDVPFIDKWTHICMYGGLCSVIWFDEARAYAAVCWRRMVWMAVLFPIALSGTMELMQAYCTTTRSGDWLDMVANTLGVALGTAFGRGVVFPCVRRIVRRSGDVGKV